MSQQDLPGHVVTNRAFWTHEAAAYVAPARRNWADPEPSWGIWGAALAVRGGLDRPPEWLSTARRSSPTIEAAKPAGSHPPKGSTCQ